MVRLTDDAGSLLRRIQERQTDSGTLRMVNEAGELVLGTSAAAAGDEVLFHQGVPVLSLSAAAAAMLVGYTIGIEQTGEGPTLQVIPPDQPSETPPTG